MTAMTDRGVVGTAFAPVPERAAYVPRPTTEAALRAVAGALEGGTRRVAIRGPAGMGKSLLLRLLEGRLPAQFDVLHVSTGVLPLADLLAFALGSRAPRAGGALPPGPTDRVLVLPIDDAEELTIPVARGLAGLVRKAEGALRLVLAVRDDPSEALVAALGGSLAEVALDQPMSEAEVALYLAVRLHRAGASEDLRRRLGAEHAARLHALAGGNPGRLNRLASELLQGHALAEPEGAPALPPIAHPPGAPLPRDPFGPTANAAAYQPRTSCETTLGQIERELLRGRCAVLLQGPTGIGKTTLLRVLETRLREPYQVVAIAYARLGPREFFDFVLHQMGAPAADDPERAVLELAERLAGVGGILVLAVDDANFLPADTAECLARALAAARGALRLVGTIDDEASQEAPALPEPVAIRFAEPLAPAEAEAYVIGRLLHFEAPIAVRRRFDRHTIETLHRASAGLPSDLNRLAGAIEREALGPVSRPAPVASPPPRTSPDPDATIAVPPPPARSQSTAPADPWVSTALGLLPHVGLGLGIPLALLALWLWLAPLFSGSGP
jgi:type II secretory pathway predicted ATPase ExeA